MDGRPGQERDFHRGPVSNGKQAHTHGTMSSNSKRSACTSSQRLRHHPPLREGRTAVPCSRNPLPSKLLLCACTNSHCPAHTLSLLRCSHVFTALDDLGPQHTCKRKHINEQLCPSSPFSSLITIMKKGSAFPRRTWLDLRQQHMHWNTPFMLLSASLMPDDSSSDVCFSRWATM